MKQHIILVGPMGAGKTTIGKLLAQELALPFKDIDHIVEQNAGASIPWIFDVEGEDGFRKREHQALMKELMCDEIAVIATGGGIVKLSSNRELLKQQSNVIFLYAPVELQLRRTAKDKNRPLLQQSNPKVVLQQLMQEREPWYREVCDYVVETGQKKPKELVSDIIQFVKDKNKPHE